MKLRSTSIQGLWLLWGLHLLGFIVLLVAFAWFQPRLSNSASNIERSEAKIPSAREQISGEQNPETLRKDALVLLDGTANQSKYVQKMMMIPIKILGTFCILSFVSTLWLGICLYKLHGQNQKDVAILPTS
jgi:hypothetical protein